MDTKTLRPFVLLRNFMLLLLPIVMGLGSCSELPCLTNKQSRLRIDFFSDSTQNPDSILYDSVLVHYELTNKTFSLNTGGDSSSQYTFSLDPESTSCWVVFRRKETGDSIRIQYKPVPAFVSESCGYYFRYTELEAISRPSSQFKHVVVSKPTVDTATLAPHVSLYF